jgi:hypothetical protein
MFLLDGNPLALDVPFVTADGTEYSADWLRSSTPEERDAIGIIEASDSPAWWDQRFYWGYDENGNLIPKDHGQLVKLWSEQTRQTANTLLSPNDWMIVREADNGVPVDPAWRTWRENVRLAAGSKVFEIEATTTTDELAAYITGPDYPVWPPDPTQPQPTPPEPVVDDAPVEVEDPETEVTPAE